jgi:hypothetical protein
MEHAHANPTALEDLGRSTAVVLLVVSCILLSWAPDEVALWVTGSVAPTWVRTFTVVGLLFVGWRFRRIGWRSAVLLSVVSYAVLQFGIYLKGAA